MTTWDAIIVGGGPGGSSAARVLVASGMRTLVIDGARFPRDKICAGWVTPGVLERLNLTPAELSARGLTVQAISGFETSLMGGRTVRTDYDGDVSYGIRRREFDAFLLERCGATVIQGTRVTSLDRVGGTWVVNDSHAAPVLVGAGGHFCPVARALQSPADHQREQPGVVLAQEIEIPLTEEMAGRVPARPEFHFSRDLGGYGWIFRKGGYLNVGFGHLAASTFKATAAAFQQWLSSRSDLPAAALECWKGHAYLLAPHGRQAVGDGVLLVGDAAGLAFPASGEGIRTAVESGTLAARTIVAAKGDYARARLGSYADVLARTFGHRRSDIVSALVPAAARQMLAPLLMRSGWFTRHVLLDRWFLRPDIEPLELA
ncbi:MAG TPA: FAD-dependent monooxygenase [Chloroflexota bacterium]|nr:FAD-dependent monooxygenase [Chloroflexota bacterium]